MSFVTSKNLKIFRSSLPYDDNDDDMMINSFSIDLLSFLSFPQSNITPKIDELEHTIYSRLIRERENRENDKVKIERESSGESIKKLKKKLLKVIYLIDIDYSSGNLDLIIYRNRKLYIYILNGEKRREIERERKVIMPFIFSIYIFLLILFCCCYCCYCCRNSSSIFIYIQYILLWYWKACDKCCFRFGLDI